MAAEATAPVPSAREVRREIREWRRGRAELSWGEVLGDAYIGLFTVVMVGAMGGNVVWSLRGLADETCAGTCAAVRSAAPWLTALALALLALGLARLLGPVFSPPAANAWLLSSPVDRGALLRPGWVRTAVASSSLAALALVAPAVLGGFAWGAGTTFVVAGTAWATTCVAVAALAQVRESTAARWLTWVVALALWVGLGLAATNRLGALPAPAPSSVTVLTALVTLASVALAWWVLASLASVSRRVLAHTAHVSPSLSGALSSVDLGLMYDVLLARRWGRSARVRSRTGGPSGWWAMVHRDALRAIRSPQPYVVLAGLALVPLAAAEADAGRAVVLATSLAGLLGGPALCAGLRVVARTGSLARTLPFGRRSLVLAHLVVPGTALLLFALTSTWALLPVAPTGEAVALALACGLSSLAATVRWITAKPPDYAAPMVSTPAGGVPPGVLGSALRGFDVWAVTALPLMFGSGGLVVSVVLSVGVLTYLVSDGAG